MKNKQKNRWWIDGILFGGLLLAFFLDLTGLALHQWIGVFLGVLAVYHLYMHWDWVSAVTRRFGQQIKGRTRLYYALDAIILTGFGLIIGTGLVISTWLDLSLGHYTTWLAVHVLVSIGALLAVAVKLGLHARWIAATTRSVVTDEPVWPPRPARPSLQPVPVVVRASATRPVSRREFLQVLSLTSLACTVALFQGTGSLQSLWDQDSATGTQVVDAASGFATNGVTTSGVITTNATTGDACTVRCNRGCSYPGGCRRYVDANNNQRCDLGECL